MSKNELVAELVELLDNEHPACEDNTCLINSEMLESYPIHIGECFDSSGAASGKFRRTYSQLAAKYKHPLNQNRLEAGAICRTIPHMECEACNAIVWDQHESHSIGDSVSCSSCLNTLTWNGVTK